MAEEKSIIDEEVLEVVRQKYHTMYPAERKVADKILQKPMEVVHYNVSELAKSSGVSDATIIRVCHRLGYEGYYQLRIALSRDLGKKQIEKEEKKGSDIPDNAVSKLFEEYAETMVSVGKNLDIDTVRACVDLIKGAGMVHIISMGNTTNVARYMGFRMERLGVRSTYSELPEYFINHINLSRVDDIVIAITKSGTSKRVLDGLKLAKDKGLKIIVMTAYANSAAAEYADYVLLSNGKQDPLMMFKGYSYLNEIAIVEALLNFTVNEELIAERGSNRPELLLAENKL